MNPLLRINNLQVEFSVGEQVITAVKGVSFSVGEGETVVLAGESGSGKTVTAFSITRILPPSARIVKGSVFFSGKDLLTIGESALSSLRGRQIAYIFQEPAAYLNPVYSIGNQIAEVLTAHRKMNAGEALREAQRLLELVKIPDPRAALGAYPHEFSGGMNQRVFIAMALACNPRLIIADEPTTALDVTIEARILELLRELKQRMGFSLLFITHNLSLARKIADRIVVMYKGEIVEEGGVDEIFHRPRHRHTRELIAAYEKIGAHRILL